LQVNGISPDGSSSNNASTCPPANRSIHAPSLGPWTGDYFRGK
jgi:hypothetical protein